MDLFSLYVLFSHFRPRGVTLGMSFSKCRLMHVHMYAYSFCYACMHNKRKIPLGTSRGLKWENKTYKLKRSIENRSKLI